MGQVVLDDLIGSHARDGIELTNTPSTWPFWPPCRLDLIVRSESPEHAVSRSRIAVRQPGLACGRAWQG
jgi:hypothetical protein